MIIKYCDCCGKRISSNEDNGCDYYVMRVYRAKNIEVKRDLCVKCYEKIVGDDYCSQAIRKDEKE